MTKNQHGNLMLRWWIFLNSICAQNKRFEGVTSGWGVNFNMLYLSTFILFYFKVDVTAKLI